MGHYNKKKIYYIKKKKGKKENKLLVFPWFLTECLVFNDNCKRLVLWIIILARLSTFYWEKINTVFSKTTTMNVLNNISISLALYFWVNWCVCKPNFWGVFFLLQCQHWAIGKTEGRTEGRWKYVGCTGAVFPTRGLSGQSSLNSFPWQCSPLFKLASAKSVWSSCRDVQILGRKPVWTIGRCHSDN